MKCSLLAKDASAERLDRVADFLAGHARSKEPAAKDRVRKMVREAAAGSGAGRLLVLSDDKGRVGGACLVNICQGMGGPYVWITEFEVEAVTDAPALARHLVAWTKEQGYTYMASAVDPAESSIRKAAKLFGMEERPAFWLEMHVQDTGE